ncbi:MAG: outer membrane protein assembly factor BamD [Gemmatimonadaceae bacterium]
MSRTFRLSILALSTLAIAACSHGFRLNRYPTNESLYQAALEQYNNKKWDNAVAGFEKLTFDLPARDTLLPRAHWYLAKAHSGRQEHLLAAQAFSRLSESFATDTLADRALFEASREYQQMWRRPTLDAQYGEQAMATYQSLLGLYPETPLKDEATKQMGLLQEWFAAKDYESGMYYFRRKAYDSAIIYFKDVVENYPSTDKSREALLRLASAYDAIRYREDRKEICATLREKYPADKEVLLECGEPADSVTPTASPDTMAARASR